MLNTGFDGHRSRTPLFSDDLCLGLGWSDDEMEWKDGVCLLAPHKSGIKRSGNPHE